MKTKKLGNTDIFVTPVGMGVLTIGYSQLDLPLEKGAYIVRYALEKGINFLDTAEYYRTYPYIRHALGELAPSFSGGLLPRPVIASKSLARSYDEMERAIDECRKELDIDQIDIFLMHEVRDGGDFENRAGAWECLKDEKSKGRVKATGISTHHTDVMINAAGMPGIDILFPLINNKGLGIRKGSGPGTKEEMAYAIRIAAEKGIGIFGMKALGGGNLTIDYKNALDYVKNLSGITSIMIGMGREKDVDDAVSWAEGSLPEDFSPDTSKKRMFIDPGDCISCGACVDRCTSKAIRLSPEGFAEVDGEKCVLCGYCAPVCPTRALILL
jgi:aryl-alcohol dehydrogenase-like predicted oxidoreductase